MERFAELENITIHAEEEFERSCERTHFRRISYTPGMPTVVHPVCCKARHCEQCGFFWAWKWRLALSDKKTTLKAMGLPPISRAITLTTAYKCGYKKFWMALKYFWRYIRTYSPDFIKPWKKGHHKLRKGKKIARFPYANIQYCGFVEENVNHTQPHMHLVIYNYGNDRAGYIPAIVVQMAWEKAQKQAKFEKIAWDTRIERIKKDVAAYFTKYITKLTSGGKAEEIPTKETWKGRYVRYSTPSYYKDGSLKRPGFFGVAVSAITTAFGFGQWCENPSSEKSYLFINQDCSLDEFIKIAKAETDLVRGLVAQPWNFEADRARAELYIDGLFDIWPDERQPKIDGLRRDKGSPVLGPPLPPLYRFNCDEFIAIATELTPLAEIA